MRDTKCHFWIEKEMDDTVCNLLDDKENLKHPKVHIVDFRRRVHDHRSVASAVS